MILIGGGSRSGKSSAALDMLRARGGRMAFVATAQAWDEEMRERIAHHRAERGPGITTFEEPLELPALLTRIASQFDGIVVDCLTLWLTNIMLAENRDVERECGGLIAAVASAPVIFVTNEVGCGIVPENALARRFRDAAGRLNQQAAAAAAEVYWTVFGIRMRIK